MESTRITKDKMIENMEIEESDEGICKLDRVTATNLSYITGMITALGMVREKLPVAPVASANIGKGVDHLIDVNNQAIHKAVDLAIEFSDRELDRDKVVIRKDGVVIEKENPPEELTKGIELGEYINRISRGD